MTPEYIVFKPIRIGRCTNCKGEAPVMKIYPIYDRTHEHEFICEECAREYNKGQEYNLFMFPSDYQKKKWSIKRTVDEKKKYNVHVPFIEKDYVVEAWDENVAVDKVIETLLNEEEIEILRKQKQISFDVELVK